MKKKNKKDPLEKMADKLLDTFDKADKLKKKKMDISSLNKLLDDE